MKTSRAVLVSCLLALGALSCECARPILMLNSTDDLKTVYEDNFIPEMSLRLLHLIANDVSIDNNNNVYSYFDPFKDFGSHHYGNYDNLLDEVPENCQYRTLGSVSRNTCRNSKEVPEYVCPKDLRNIPSENRARIILCMSQNMNRRRIHQTYLTQHYEKYKSSAYDPTHTFRINPELLKELQQFSFNDDVRALQSLRDQYNRNIDNRQLDDIINRWSRTEAPLGLLILLMNLFQRRMKRSSGSEPTYEWQNCELQQMNVDVITGDDGYARILWRNVPQDLIKDGAAIAVYNNKMDQNSLEYVQISSSEGSYDTFLALEEGLQARLHRLQSSWFWSTVKEEICRGKEFQSPEAVSITNYAKLQLFVRNGYSCFRIDVDDCDEWKTYFSNSWVALYESKRESTENYLYKKWNWVTRFQKVSDSGDSKRLEYCTGAVVNPGLQARFMIDDYNEKARTPEWPIKKRSKTNHHFKFDELK